MRIKISLETQQDVIKFVNAVQAVDVDVTVSDNTGLKVNAKSVLGMLYSLEFKELWCESEKDITHLIWRYMAV